MSTPTQFALLRQRRFAPFFWTQFLGALNDNVFKIALLTVLTYDTARWTSLDIGLLNNLIPGLFILPFVLFSATAGQLADKLEKANLTRAIKLAEIAIMLLAAYGWHSRNLWLLVAAVAGMGMHSTFFGPVKYAYLPQQLNARELVGGNGLVEMGTFVGILLGEILGAVLVQQQPWGVQGVALATLLIAVLGWLGSRRMPLAPAADPDLRINWNPWSETWRNLRFSRRNRAVFAAMLANSWFWFYGAILLAQFPLYSRDYLGGDYGVFVLLLMGFSLGIGAGSLACERLSGGRPEPGLVLLGLLSLSLFGMDLFWASGEMAGAALTDASGFLARPGSLRILLDCVLIGAFGGIYVVPLFVLIQTRCDPRHLSRTIAGMNVLNALFMVVAALLAMLLLQAGASIPQIFLAAALLNALAALILCRAMPEFPLRFLVWLLAGFQRRLEVRGGEGIPARGPALLHCPDGAAFDTASALSCLTVAPRPMRLVMPAGTSGRGLAGWLHRQAGTLFVQGGPGQGLTDAEKESLQATLAAGELLWIGLPANAPLAADLAELRREAPLAPPVIPVQLAGIEATGARRWKRPALLVQLGAPEGESGAPLPETPAPARAGLA